MCVLRGIQYTFERKVEGSVDRVPRGSVLPLRATSSGVNDQFKTFLMSRAFLCLRQSSYERLAADACGITLPCVILYLYVSMYRKGV